MSETQLRVPEMSCQGCVDAVSGALEGLAGVTTVDVDLETKLVRIEHDRDLIATEQLRSAVEDQGYDVSGWDPR